jgi:hypothetical protein
LDIAARGRLFFLFGRFLGQLAGARWAAGVEVWFDWSEPGGGNAWDQKIRGR